MSRLNSLCPCVCVTLSLNLRRSLLALRSLLSFCLSLSLSQSLILSLFRSVFSFRLCCSFVLSSPNIEQRRAVSSNNSSDSALVYSVKTQKQTYVHTNTPILTLLALSLPNYKSYLASSNLVHGSQDHRQLLLLTLPIQTGHLLPSSPIR